MTLQTLIKQDKKLADIPAPVVATKRLDKEALNAVLKAVVPLCQQAAPATGHRVRLGKNNTERLSRYRYIREYDMPRSVRKILAATLAEAGLVIATHWLLHFEKGDFLDEQDAWANVPTVVDFEAVAMCDGQTIILKGETYTLNAGDSIRWRPCLAHEIPEVADSATWLGAMVFSHLEQRA